MIYSLPTELSEDYRYLMTGALSSAIREALGSPCCKSKRGATVFSTTDATRFTCHNRPPPPFTCLGSRLAIAEHDACRAACGALCLHAEERCVSELRWMRAKEAHRRADTLTTWITGMPPPPREYDVLHIELVDGQPVPFDRPGKPAAPSCITCARAMVDAKVRLVWLFGVAGWRSWTAVEFMRDTILELKLLPASALVGIR